MLARAGVFGDRFWPVAAARRHCRQLAGWPLGVTACVPLVNSGGQSNFSRSHEHAPHINACKRHPGDAAVSSAFPIRLSARTCASTCAADIHKKGNPRWPDHRPASLVQCRPQGEHLRIQCQVWRPRYGWGSPKIARIYSTRGSSLQVLLNRSTVRRVPICGVI